MKILATTILVLLSACQAIDVERLPSYDIATHDARDVDFRCLRGTEVDATSLPTLVPFARASYTHGGGKAGFDYAARDLAKQAVQSMHPDVIILHDGGTYYAGSTSVAQAFPAGGGAMAIGSSIPHYSSVLVGICYRLSPVALGFSWDDSGMVLTLDEQARSSGLIEGDRIVSIDGAEVGLGQLALRSPHYSKLLSRLPGDQVPIVWIRPGTGRMEGRLTMASNPPRHLDIRGIDLTPPPPRQF